MSNFTLEDYEDGKIRQLAIGGSGGEVEALVSSISEIELTRGVASAIDNTLGLSHLKHLRPKVEERSTNLEVWFI